MADYSSPPAAAPPRAQRRFLRVGDRAVHYLRAGAGKPVVLIHSSPANVRLLAKEIARLARDFTVFAFDTPGFGLSDPLPLDPMTVADLADAMAGTLAAIEMPRCPVFGTHTGAAIALELGVRHPERVSGLVLDGVPAFTDAECETYFRDYFRALPVTDLGGQYSEAWTRFRDQSVWFPWSEREPANLNGYDLGPPASTQLWVEMFFDAAEHYTPAYRAASFYGARAIAATAALTLPAVFTASETDMLYPHLARLPHLRDGQRIAGIGNSYERKRDLIAEAFAAWPADGPAPDAVAPVGSSATVARQFVDAAAGQVHLRYAGDRASPALLLLHDCPGSSAAAEALIARLAARFFVVAPDLPGCGESDPLTAPGIDDFAAVAAALLDTLGIGAATAYGIGFGASVALALVNRHPARITAVAVQGILLPDAAERADLAAHYAPPIEIAADGSHWYATWLMLRDAQVWWPWYDRRHAALRRVAADFAARPLHRATLDVMRARGTYWHPVAAALADDAAAALATLTVPLVQVHDPLTPLAVYDGRLAATRTARAVLTAADPDFVAALANFVAEI